MKSSVLPVGHITCFLFPEGAVQALAVTDRTLIKMHCTAGWQCYSSRCATTPHYISETQTHRKTLTQVVFQYQMFQNIHITERQTKKNPHTQKLRRWIYIKRLDRKCSVNKTQSTPAVLLNAGEISRLLSKSIKNTFFFWSGAKLE